MKQGLFEIVSNREIARGSFELTVKGDFGNIVPGQFVQISVPGYFLRRPFSVCDFTGDTLSVVYHISGQGTEALSRIGSGTLDMLVGLGNGYDMEKCGDKPLLISGGTGATPVHFLAKAMHDKGIKAQVIMGFASEADVFCYDRICAMGHEVLLFTQDGSTGRQGLVTDGMEGLEYSMIYSCGPMAMLRAINGIAESLAQFSLEARMGCGIGACMGCTIETNKGAKRVCADGPVFFGEDIRW